MNKHDDGLTIPVIQRLGVTVAETFWTLLAYQHDGLAAESEVARLAHLDAAKHHWWSEGSLRGAAIAKRLFVREIQAARERFARDLQREREWLDYKAGLRSIPYPVVGESRDWRSRRELPRRPIQACHGPTSSLPCRQAQMAATARTIFLAAALLLSGITPGLAKTLIAATRFGAVALDDHGAVRCPRALVTQIGCDRPAGRSRQREGIDAPGLGPAQAKRPLVPVDIFQPKVGYFAASQAEIGEAPQHREGAPMRPEGRIE